MFFKNIVLYQLASPFTLTCEALNRQLSQRPFMTCPRSESFSCGWVSPYGLEQPLLVHALQGYLLFAFCKEEKILPATVIREETAKKIAQLEQQEDRILYRKEKIEMKEQVTITLRQQAFSRKKITFAYFDTQANYLLIDTSSRTKAEEICSFLRETLGSLKLALPQTHARPEAIMTSWLLQQENLPCFQVQHSCDMLDPRDKIGMIKCKEQDLNAQEIISHLHSGKQIVKLALNWQDKITFEFSDDLSIKKIKFLDLIRNQRTEVKSQSQQEQLDADFAIMSGEISHFLRDLWTLFDGLVTIDKQ